MSTSDYALIVGIASIFISIGGLVWNVWQKFLFVKPSLHVAFNQMNILQPSSDGLAHPTGQRLLTMTVTNMGPGPVVLYQCVAERNSVKPRFGIMNPIHGNPTASQPTSLGPFSAGLPIKIDAGDTKDFHFPFTLEGFLKDGIRRVGVNDTFRRNTWCSKTDMKRVNEAYRQSFGG